MQREDPDLTVYEDVSQILLKENIQTQSAKKVRVVTSSQEICSQEETDNEQNEVFNSDQEENDPKLYVTLNPDDVSNYLSKVEASNNVLVSQPDQNEDLSNKGLNGSDLIPMVNSGNIENPKHSSTPANRKLKRTKPIDPEDINAMEIKRVDTEAANAIKEAADKIMQAAAMIVNCMQELKPEIKSLSNRNYREIQMSTNAVKQLVSVIRKLGVFEVPSKFVVRVNKNLRGFETKFYI